MASHTTPSPYAFPTGLSCPSSDTAFYTFQQHTFQIACFNDSMFCDINTSGARRTGSLENCIAECVKTPECIDVSYKPSCDECWLKREVNHGTYNVEVWGAKMVDAMVLTTSTSTSVATVKTRTAVASGSASGSGFVTSTRA